jgi:hypothetical protein
MAQSPMMDDLPAELARRQRAERFLSVRAALRAQAERTAAVAERLSATQNGNPLQCGDTPGVGPGAEVPGARRKEPTATSFAGLVWLSSILAVLLRRYS